mmetsp:Transcript_442/g.424  ORF Transcript_442/g.424 Transcript_442/m.424 type:complete len:157 (+) Transcript_442:268-738(+)
MNEIRYPMGDGVYRLKPNIDDGKIPLLRDVFEEFPEMPMNIDLKGGSPEHLFEVYKMIVEFQREGITFFGDMNNKKNIKAQEMGKDAGIGSFSSLWYTTRTVLLYLFGLLQFFPFRHQILWFPLFGRKTLNAIYEHSGRKCLVWFLLKIVVCITWL